MKPSLLPILLLLFLSESLSFGQKADYYWYGNSKRNLVEDTTQLLVELKNSDNAVFSKLKSVSGYRNQRIKKGGNIQIILRNNPETKEAIRTLNPIFKSYAMTIFGEVSPAFIADEISVKFIQSPQAISNFEDKYGLKLVKVTSYGAYIFKVVNDKLTLQTANRIKENESVEWSSPDFVSIIVKHNDPLFPDQYYLNNTGQFGGTSGIDIRAVQAWQITYGCNNVRVAVVDDGVDNHEDFSGRVVSGYTVGNNTNGAPVNTCDATHGVMCAGIIAATHNNGMGIRGVAPNTIVVPINIFPDGLAGQVATDSEIAEAVDWAWQSNKGNADIISMSFGATTIQYDLQSVISTARTNGRGGKGTIFVASSGNRGSQGITSPGNIDGVITVGAVDKSGNIWSYSGRGSSLDVVAPAGETTGGFEDCTPLSGDVRTTDRMGGNGTESGNYTTGFGGTSAACPQVAGIAALMISINPNLTEVQVTSILQQTARDLGSPGFDNDYGHGLVNAEKALNAIFPISGPSILTCYTASNYSVSTPSGYSYFWSVSSNLSMVGGQYSSTISVIDNNSGGSAWIQVTLITPCGANVTLRRDFNNSGIPTVDETRLNGSPIQAYNLNQVCINNSFNISTTVKGQTSIGWTIINNNSGASIINSYDNYANVATGYTEGAFTMKLSASNSCGTVERYYPFYANNCGYYRYAVFPNPTQNELNIGFENINEQKEFPELYELYEESMYGSGKPVRIFSAQNDKAKQELKRRGQITLDVRDLPRGRYVLRVLKEKEIEKEKKVDEIRVLLN